MTPPKGRHLRVIAGAKDALSSRKKRLGEDAKTLAAHWSAGQIGLRGQVRLLETLKSRMPGITDDIIRLVGPALLAALAEQAISGEISDEAFCWLVHMLAPPKSLQTRIAESTMEGELNRIRQELALLPRNWSLVVDPEGHYIDIIGHPQMPTSVDFDASKDILTPEYDEVNVATVYLEQPENELRAGAHFISRAPSRIEHLLSLLDSANDDLKRYQNQYGPLAK